MLSSKPCETRSPSSSTPSPTEINLLRKLHALVAEWERAAGDKAE
jgi:hypothetical protein